MEGGFSPAMMATGTKIYTMIEKEQASVLEKMVQHT